MRDPYTFLGEELAAAAVRHEAHGLGERGVRAWLSARLHAAVIAAALVLVGGAVAVAATGVLTGSPVTEPEGSLSPSAGDGVPAVGGSQLLALRTDDPEGGLAWGMRVVRTTRGQVCVQVGRIDDGQLGELGLDGAFHDDGRFHLLAADILPKFGGDYDTNCVPNRGDLHRLRPRPGSQRGIDPTRGAPRQAGGAQSAVDLLRATRPARREHHLPDEHGTANRSGQPRLGCLHDRPAGRAGERCLVLQRNDVRGIRHRRPGRFLSARQRDGGGERSHLSFRLAGLLRGSRRTGEQSLPPAPPDAAERVPSGTHPG